MARKSAKTKYKKEKEYLKRVGSTIKKQQGGQSPLEKINGVTPSVGTGIDPITNTSYPKRKKK